MHIPGFFGHLDMTKTVVDTQINNEARVVQSKHYKQHIGYQGKMCVGKMVKFRDSSDDKNIQHTSI